MPNYHPVERSFFYGGYMETNLEVISRDDARARGMKFFFTGEPCKHGHISVRKVINGGCLECVRSKSREWYYLNTERAKENVNKYRDENKEKLRESARKWEQDNRDRINMLRRQRREERREMGVSEPDKWMVNNRERYNYLQRMAKQKRKTRARVNIDGATYRKWLESTEKICRYCAKDCTDDFHVDHFLPIAKGGNHELCNLVISCPRCNLKKSDKMPSSFINQINENIFFNC